MELNITSQTTYLGITYLAGPTNVPEYIGQAMVAAGLATLLVKQTPIPSGLTVLARAGAPSAALTGSTTETVIASVTIPAGALKNAALRLDTQWSHTNNANNKTLKMTIGGQTVFSVVQTTTASTSDLRTISNPGTGDVQRGPNASATGATAFGGATGATLALTLDTDSPLVIEFRGQLANAADSITLEDYVVEIVKG